MTREAAEALTSFRKEVRFDEPVLEVKEVKREKDEGELGTQLSLKSATDIPTGDSNAPNPKAYSYATYCVPTEMVAEVLKIEEGTDPCYKTALDPDPETLKQFKVKPAETEPDDELMDEDAEGEPDPGSPPNLVYPLEESGTTVDSEERMIVIPMDPAEIEEMAKEKWEARPERESVGGTEE